MNKAELIARMADKTDLTQKQAGAALAALTDTIVEALKEYDKVQLSGFGTFEVRTRAARTGRNPQTGETIEIAKSKVPAFKVGKGLKEAVE